MTVVLVDTAPLTKVEVVKDVIEVTTELAQSTVLALYAPKNNVVVNEHLNQVVVDSQAVVVITEDKQGPRGITGLKGDKGIQGDRGLPGLPGDIVPNINFAFGDATPSLITTIAGGNRVIRVTLSIDIAFNGLGATLSVGPADAPQELTEGLIDAGYALIYDFVPSVIYVVDTPIYLFITPGSGASAGSGNVLVNSQ